MSEEKALYILPGITTRNVLIQELLKILNMEYLAVLVWRLAQAERLGFGSVTIQFKNGRPDLISWTGSEKPSQMDAKDIECLTEQLVDYGSKKQ